LYRGFGLDERAEALRLCGCEGEGAVGGGVGDGLGEQEEGCGGTADPLDVLLREAFEPGETVLGNDDGEEVGDCVVVVGVGQDEFPLPFRV